MQIFAFSDGGCSNNGKKNAVASFAAVIIDGKTKKIIRGKVKPYEYNLTSDLTTSDLTTNTVSVLVSNNRGELLGLIYCFKYLLEYDPGEIEIISDSLISIKTLTKWLPDRRKKNTAHELKNFDLVSIAETLFILLQKKHKSVIITHINSHQIAPLDSSSKEYFKWKGNQLADKQCELALLSAIDIEII